MENEIAEAILELTQQLARNTIALVAIISVVAFLIGLNIIFKK